MLILILLNILVPKCVSQAISENTFFEEGVYGKQENNNSPSAAPWCVGSHLPVLIPPSTGGLTFICVNFSFFLYEET